MPLQDTFDRITNNCARWDGCGGGGFLILIFGFKKNSLGADMSNFQDECLRAQTASESITLMGYDSPADCWKNCAFHGKSTKFGIHIEYDILYQISYGPI